MPRYIDADRLLKELSLYADRPTSWAINVIKGMAMFPAADFVERKKGRWIWANDVMCSNCHYKLQTTGLPSYCPNCFAEMEGETR